MTSRMAWQSERESVGKENLFSMRSLSSSSWLLFALKISLQDGRRKLSIDTNKKAMSIVLPRQQMYMVVKVVL